MMDRKGLAALATLGGLIAGGGYARADDATVCIAASERALGEVSSQQLLEARTSLATCAAQACPDVIKASCKRRFDEVNRAIPAVVFEMKDSAGNDLAEVAIVADGRPLADHHDGAPVVLNPGKHSFRFDVVGHPPVYRDFVFRQGERDRHERITFADLSPAAPAVATSEVKADGAVKAKAEEPTGSFWTPLRVGGMAAGGVGVVGMIVGSAFGLMVPRDKQSAHCNAEGVCFTGPLNTANLHANISTASFIAGGVLIAAGGSVVLFAPKGEATKVQLAPTLTLRGGGIVLGGAF